MRYGEPKPNEPAEIHYAKLEGTREEKLEQLSRIQSFADVTWQDAFSGWQNPFLPEGEADYYAWPLLTDVFPWQHSGVQLKRNYPIAESKEVLQKRWEMLLSASIEKRAELFRETGARKISGVYENLNGSRAPALATLSQDAPQPPVARYGFRSFDRQWTWADTRFADRLRNDLWRIAGPEQVFFTSLSTEVLGSGPAATVTAYVPDMNCFHGRNGKVVPLWRDAAASQPNVTAGLLDTLSEAYGVAVSAEDMFTYAYGILASPSYVETFSEELVLPGPRLPVTKDAALFREVAALGRTLIGLHTYGERMGGRIPRGEARNAVAVPTTSEGYPGRFSYDPQTRTLRVGSGEFAPVSPEVWEFSVSGLRVLRSWLGYRMRERSGRSSSELDAIRPERWTAELTRELLELLWVLEATVAAWPELAEKLDAVVGGAVFTALDFPVPTDAERKAPEVGDEGAQGTLGL